MLRELSLLNKVYLKVVLLTIETFITRYCILKEIDIYNVKFQ